MLDYYLCEEEAWRRQRPLTRPESERLELLLELDRLATRAGHEAGWPRRSCAWA